MAVSKVAVRMTAEFLLYFVTLMVYMGIASLFGYDAYSFETIGLCSSITSCSTSLPASP